MQQAKILLYTLINDNPNHHVYVSHLSGLQSPSQGTQSSVQDLPDLILLICSTDVTHNHTDSHQSHHWRMTFRSMFSISLKMKCFFPRMYLPVPASPYRQ